MDPRGPPSVRSIGSTRASCSSTGDDRKQSGNRGCPVLALFLPSLQRSHRVSLRRSMKSATGFEAAAYQEDPEDSRCAQDLSGPSVRCAIRGARAGWDRSAVADVAVVRAQQRRRLADRKDARRRGCEGQRRASREPTAVRRRGLLKRRPGQPNSHFRIEHWKHSPLLVCSHGVRVGLKPTTRFSVFPVVVPRTLCASDSQSLSHAPAKTSRSRVASTQPFLEPRTWLRSPRL